MNIKAIAKTAGQFIVKNSSIILVSLGSVGVITTTVLAAKQMPKAKQALDDAYDEYGDSITSIDKIKAVAKPAAPVIISAGLTLAANVGAVVVSIKNQKKLEGALAFTQQTLSSYQNAIMEKFGEKVHDELHDNVVKDRLTKMEKDNDKKSDVDSIILSNDQDLYIDFTSGRKFAATANDIKSAENHINAEMIESLNWGLPGFYTLNDAYIQLGLDPIGIGEYLGWDIEQTGLLKITTTPIIIENRPYIGIDFSKRPTEKFLEFNN